ncbi:hypothetical protein [Geobacillus phage GBSV1]|uniref:Uncharacterized protein n=2 Tax=Svunavirus TaxID=2169625 RepID=A6XMI6_9CAUD|nr:hypothetical protein BV1_gp09 [Bacillus phage 1]YP_764465.1 hypothetical protein GPGV1_gp09 [Geobacillus phage GBSV1]ABC61265.1 hypothetical protein [Geobacillus phage GBSV1]ABJ09609.1 hypothetical protein [Bacillus phage 1]
MLVRFSLLYKSGYEDVIEQVCLPSEVGNIIQTIRGSFYEDSPGYISFGDENLKGYIINVQEVARVKMEILEGGDS